jgi:nucleoside 2-deoxyribosyltransferase
MRPSVYLAGPIKGLNYDEAVTWRETAKKQLKEAGIDAFSPMRAKNYLKNDKNIDSSDSNYSMYPLSVPPAVVCRDMNDCTKRDALIVYLKGAKAVSIGTVCEIAWAAQARIPIVLVMEKEGNPHEHMFVRQLCNFQVESLDEAIFCIKAILLP